MPGMRTGKVLLANSTALCKDFQRRRLLRALIRSAAFTETVDVQFHLILAFPAMLDGHQPDLLVKKRVNIP